ncbi:MAG TPA: hypothetical protein DEP46_12745, partial [Blastocatellia bacterium]|nr:hypothetical protein [Blastocatellia bacterium]
VMFAVRTHLLFIALSSLLLCPAQTLGQSPEVTDPETILRKAINFVGGEKYLNAKNQVGRG